MAINIAFHLWYFQQEQFVKNLLMESMKYMTLQMFTHKQVSHNNELIHISNILINFRISISFFCNLINSKLIKYLSQ